MGATYSANVEFSTKNLDSLKVHSIDQSDPLQIPKIYQYNPSTDLSSHVLSENSDEKPEKCLRFVCISDTHTWHQNLKLPAGDVLIHAGDFTKWPSPQSQVDSFNEWLGTIPFKYKVVVGGNHDKIILSTKSAKETRDLYLPNCTHYLQDTGAEIEGIKFWGAPWHVKRAFFYLSNNFGLSERDATEKSMANESAETEIEHRFNLIPEDTDILITHVPPIGIHDRNHRDKPIGSKHLLATDLLRVKPRVHVFGHNHHQPGASLFKSEENEQSLEMIRRAYGGTDPVEWNNSSFQTLFVNAAQMETEKASPVVFDYYYR